MRKNRLAENENYHIYNRGVGKQKIFHDDEDYKRFLKLMYICNNQKRFKFKDLLKLKRNIFDLNRENIIVNVHFYTLMPNHFHICLNSTFPKGG